MKSLYRNRKGYRTWININMRCIEILKQHSLKMEMCQININMRCIEMDIPGGGSAGGSKININMRCIEIELYYCLISCV